MESRLFEPTLGALLSRIREHEAAIREFGISHIDLFGSWARGTETAESDVDLVVEYEPDRQASYFHLARVKALLEENLGIHVDILMRSGFLSRGKDPGATVRVF
jgi:predicted nucleotidyltransferase